MRLIAPLLLLLATLWLLLIYLPAQQDESGATSVSTAAPDTRLNGLASGTAADTRRRSELQYPGTDSDDLNPREKDNNSRRQSQRPGNNPFRAQSGRAATAADSAQSEQAQTETRRQKNAAQAATSNQIDTEAAMTADAEEEESASGSISGRVMDNQGEPVAGAEVLATQQPDAQGNAGGEQYVASAAADGWFTLRNLPRAEYIVSARDPVSGGSSNSARASTGTAMVDLMIPLLNEVVLFGAVTNSEQQPVAGVRLVLVPSAQSTSSDELGVYLLPAQLRNEQGYQLIAEHDAYADARVSVSARDWQQTPEWQVDVQLQRQDQTTVSGRLLDDTGAAVSGENLYLQGQRNSFQARADAAGNFIFNKVVPGPGYQLSVSPQRDYGNFKQSGIEVPADGLAGLEVVLQALQEGTVRGQFVDPFGAPLPGFSAELLVQRFRSPLTADAQGKFMLEQVPAGAVQVRHDGHGRLLTRGAQLAPEGELRMQVVMDVGAGQYIGTLLNEAGMPVAGATVNLLWRRQQQGLLHESAREAISDANGRFAFTGHAAIEHELLVQAAGYRQLRTSLAAQTTASELRLQSQ